MSTEELFRQRMQRLTRAGHDGQHDWHVYQWLSHQWRRTTIVDEVVMTALLPLVIILLLPRIWTFVRTKFARQRDLAASHVHLAASRGAI
jgi:hypothetical protein